MKEIILTQGKITLVDDDVYERLNQYKWFAHKNKKTFYAERNSSQVDGKQYTIKMHHEIIGRPPRGLMTDHVDGNGLNDQRENLRFVTNRQNTQNRQNCEDSSRYPGVIWDGWSGKWIARIMINKKRKNLGRFLTELDAFQAYKQAVEANGETMI